MNFLLKIFLILGFIITLSYGYTLSVSVDNPIINSVTGYTFVFGFADSTVRNVTLNFPDTSDLSSASMTVFINNAGTALATSSYTTDLSLKKITINNITPISNTLTIRITNIKNPPSALQFNFITQIVPTVSLSISVPFINYERGTLLSCAWKFDKFTGSTGSTADITILLGNKLLQGNNQLQVQFPNLYEDSDSQYLTLGSNPTITYSLDNGTTYLSPLSSPTTFISNTRINFWINLATQLPGGSTFKIRFDGIVNPPTTNPSGRNFIVSTFDSNGRGIDRITQCSIDPVAVLEIQGTFDQSTLYVNDLYSNPKIIVNSLIPFTVFQNDALQMDHNQALRITNSTPLQISLTRGSPFVSFYLDATQPATTTSSYFKGNLDNYNSGNAYSQIQLKFTINAPYSQKPWDFAIWLKRTSGAYVKIKATLQAIAIPINSGNVTITPLSTQMAVQSQYTLNLKLQRAISRNGKILLGFNPDFNIAAGPCTGSIAGLQITSASSCELVTRLSTPYLSFKINDALSSTIDIGTTITIQFSSSTIRNPLYPNLYTFRLQVYYTQLDDSLVEQAAIIGGVQMTRHFSFRGGLLTNDFIVYQMATLTITYTNDVYIPQNTALQFVLPLAVYSFDFVGNISINTVNVTNATYDKSFAGGKTGQVTIRQPIAPGTLWQIPLLVRMPNIVGDYPSITFKLMNSTQIYEQVDSGLMIRVKFPSPQLTALIQPKTNNMIDATSDYLLRLVSRVPLAGSFYVILTTPAQISIGTTLSCSSTNGTCSSIQKPSNTVLNLTFTNSPYSATTTVQQFLFTVNQFVNPRFQGSTSLWRIQLKGLYNGALADISETNVASTSYVHSSGVLCVFDPTKNYFKGNTQTVVISCTFANNLIQGDNAQITFTSNSYLLNTGSTFACSSPSQTNAVQCQNTYSSATTLKIGVTILTTFTSNRNKLTLEISGLISYSGTTYYDSSAAIPISRFDSSQRLIDTGIFYYDINCNENSTIIAKSCKTCLNSICISCFSSMFLATNGTCVRDCASDTQFRSLNNLNTSQCQPCSLPCYTCQNSSTTCLSCINSTYYLYRSTHTCQLTCDTSSLYWINSLALPGQNICDSCLTQCRVCVNNSYNGCIQCQANYVLQNGVCRTSCLDPSSYLYNGICIRCDSACATCTGGGANNCVQCRDLYYMNSGYCVAQCPSNKYPLSNWTCGCQGSCRQCNNQSSTFCTQCIDTTNFIFNGTCLSSCPTYTFLLGNQCVQCPDNCIQCSTATSCTRCASSYYYYEGKCYFDCNTISFQYDARGNSCVLCPTGCDTCADNVCYTCLEEYSKNGTQCIKSCILTNSCAVQSPVPNVVTPLPASIVFFVWVCVVFVAKFFNPKLYPPYAIVFFTAAIQLCLILGTAIYTGQLTSQVLKRMLAMDLTQRPVILNLLIVALVLNYVMNIIFAIIFWKYIYPLIKDPRQVDYITIGVVMVLGMLTNYRFTLLMFSKMFPKPRIHVQFASRLTPIHYLCIVSVFLSGFALGAAGMILKNQYPLTDLFMLGIDIIIIEAILILFSIWMVATNKDESYFEGETKKYHLEENQRTQGNVFDNTDQKNMSKHNLQIRDQFMLTQGQLPQDNLRDSTNSNYRRMFTKTSLINPNNQASDFQRPLQKFSQTSKVNIQKPKATGSNNNKINNSFDTDISALNKTSKKLNKNSSLSNKEDNQQLKNKIKQIDSGKKKQIIQGNIFQSSEKKFQTEDDDQLPKQMEKKQLQNILVNIDEPQSQQIPNLPLTNSIFHQRASSQFGHKIKPTKINSKANQQQRSQTNLSKKSPMKSSNKTMKPADIISRTQAKPNMMKKKNRFFQSQAESQIVVGVNKKNYINTKRSDTKKQSPNKNNKKDTLQVNDVDIQSIIKSKIVVIQNKDDNKFANTTLGDPNNISSIDKKDDQNSQFNQQVSPSWFNIQNQRFDFSQMGSQFSDN